MMAALMVGDMVHFVPDEIPKSTKCLPAVIVEVGPRGLYSGPEPSKLGLCILNPNGIEFWNLSKDGGCSFAEEQLVNGYRGATWHRLDTCGRTPDE